jgi:DNA polymerase III subunit beta
VKFRCERDVLAEALTAAGRAVSPRSSLPVLSGILLDLHGNELRVTGSDLDTTISAAVMVDGASDGVAVVNARLITDIVRALDAGAVTVSVEDDEASIMSGRSAFSVRTIPANEFPNLAEPAGSAVVLDAPAFASAVRQVLPAASQDLDRPILRGVQMETEDDGVRLVATDSYRLAVRDLPGASILDQGQSVLVPRNALQELVRMLDGATELTLRIGERDVSFDVDGSRITTRLIEGQFPNYRSLIPHAHPNRLTVNRGALIEAVKRVKVVVRDASTPIRLLMKPDGLELSVNTQDYGTGFEQLDATFEGTELAVAFNPDYLIAGAEAASGEEVAIETIDNLKPALLTCPADPEYRYVLMPVRFP